MKKIIIANWKMQLNLTTSIALARSYKKLLAKRKHEVVACPSEFALADVKATLAGSGIKLGAQNVFWENKGAYTGEVSAAMLGQLGCKYVIIGHSERREYLKETDEMISEKVRAAIQAKLIPIICVGETVAESKAKKSKAVLARQTRKALEGVTLGKQQLILAYEPIWAIGTGQAIEPADADERHYYLRSLLERILGPAKARKQCLVIYGGSVDEHNSAQLLDLKYVDGLLVGGASLSGDKMAKIS
jgi:triosephosphate isomerase